MDIYAFVCRDDEETGPILFIEYRDDESKKWVQTWYKRNGLCLGDGDYFTEFSQTPDQVNSDMKKQSEGISRLVETFKKTGDI